LELCPIISYNSGLDKIVNKDPKSAKEEATTKDSTGKGFTTEDNPKRKKIGQFLGVL